MQTAKSLEKTLMLGKIEGRLRRGQQRMGWLDGITDSMDMSFSKVQKVVKDREACMLQSMGSQRVGHNWVNEQEVLIKQLTRTHCVTQRNVLHILQEPIKKKTTRNHIYTCTCETICSRKKRKNKNTHKVVIHWALQFKRQDETEITEGNSDSIPLRTYWCHIPGAWLVWGPKAGVSWGWGSWKHVAGSVSRMDLECLLPSGETSTSRCSRN